MKPLIIGIAGGTGSGKTTLVDRLLEQFGDDISVLPHDNYYAAHHDLSLEQRQTLNYDHPASFDTDRMIQDLQALRAGKTIHCPVYDYAIHDRTEETRELKPNKVILVEGILIFENKTLRDLMDIKLFVDTDADVRILRRIVRDVRAFSSLKTRPSGISWTSNSLWTPTPMYAFSAGSSGMLRSGAGAWTPWWSNTWPR